MTNSDKTRDLDPVLVNRVLWKIPNVLCLIGSRAEATWNAMTASWVTQLSMDPVLIGVSIDVTAVTNRLVREGGAFSVNLWDRSDTRPFVKFSKPALFDDMTLNGRPIRQGESGVPIFTEAAAWIECDLFHTVPLGTHDLFVGEVIDVGIGSRGDEVPVARMEDTRMKYGGVRRGAH